MFSWTWSRPVQVLYWPLTQAAFGLDTGLHLAWALFTAVIMSASLYAVLRTLGLERMHSAAIAALVLIFPASDATRLWSAASIVNVGISLYLAGTLVALRALRHGGRRGVLVHAAAECLYVLSLLTYEVAAVAILLSILVYRRRAEWRRAAPRWLADVVATAVTLAIFTSNTFYEPRPLFELPIRAAVLPSTYLDPLGAGQDNRTNALPAVGVIALVYALLIVTARSSSALPAVQLHCEPASRSLRPC
jgi:hypothetical protein